MFGRVLAGSSIAALAALPAIASAFDCKASGSPLSALICSDRNLLALDDRLNHLYRAALAKSKDAAALKAGQRHWVESKQALCKDAVCLKAAYTAQIDTLAQSMAPWCESTLKTSFPGPWKRVGETGSIESFSAGTDGSFDSWVDRRPEIAGGRWTAHGCRITVMQNDAAFVELILIDTGKPGLKLLEDDITGVVVYRP